MNTPAGVPMRFGGLGERGRRYSAETGGGSTSLSGWGARLIPAHCHLWLERVERYRE